MFSRSYFVLVLLRQTLTTVLERSLKSAKKLLISRMFQFLHLMYSFYSFFHQGYLTLQHIDPYLKNLNVLVSLIKAIHTLKCSGKSYHSYTHT